MVLGQLYIPSGLALELSQIIFREKEGVYACNVAMGCSNACGYCYLFKTLHCTREQACIVRQPKTRPVDLVKQQLDKEKISVKAVSLSYLTDPFLSENRVNTEELTQFLRKRGIKVSILSKISTFNLEQIGVIHGATIVSLDNDFWRTYEPNAESPEHRLMELQHRKMIDKEQVFVSMEPYPPSKIHKQSLSALLDRLWFVDLIVFGKLNYDPLGETDEYRQEMVEHIQTIKSFCRQNNIRLHVKSETLDFVKGTS